MQEVRGKTKTGTSNFGGRTVGERPDPGFFAGDISLLSSSRRRSRRWNNTTIQIQSDDEDAQPLSLQPGSKQQTEVCAWPQALEQAQRPRRPPPPLSSSSPSSSSSPPRRHPFLPAPPFHQNGHYSAWCASCREARNETRLEGWGIGPVLSLLLAAVLGARPRQGRRWAVVVRLWRGRAGCSRL